MTSVLDWQRNDHILTAPVLSDGGYYWRRALIPLGEIVYAEEETGKRSINVLIDGGCTGSDRPSCILHLKTGPITAAIPFDDLRRILNDHRKGTP